jgi:membrane protein
VRDEGGAGAGNELTVGRVASVYFQSAKDFLHDSGPQWAAAIAYYSLLSTFPLLLAAVSIASYFVDPQWAIEQGTAWLGEFIPRGTGEIESIVSQTIEQRGGVGVLSIITLLWSGSRVFGVVTKGLNIAYDVDETYGFLKRTLVELIMLLTVGLLFVLALASGSLLNFLSGTLVNILGGDGRLMGIAVEVVPAVLLFTAFALTYLLVPRQRVSWQAAVVGAITATALYLLAQPVFLRYVQQFANYSLIYGSIAVIIILLFWSWLVGMMLLFGGEVTSHIEAMIIEGYSAEEVERRHKARSPSHRDRRSTAGSTPAGTE